MSGTQRRRAAVLAGALFVLATGCYHGSARTVSLDDVDREPGWVRVRGVPLIRQQAVHDCGAAALAMVLERWGLPDTTRDIRTSLKVPADHGIAAAELRRYARERGLRAFLLSGKESDLIHEVGAERPVLVGLIQRYTSDKALSHYEVVIGINETTRRVLLLDPGNGPREDALASFDQEWGDAGRLMLVVAPS